MSQAKTTATPGQHAAVRLNDLSLTLPSQAGPVEILRSLNLDIDAGESVSIVGPSGSGKSSMMMIIGGLERPTSGKVVVAGEDLGRLNEDGLARFRREHMGIVFQDFHLIPTMTALENVAMPLEFAGRADAFDQAAESLKTVGLAKRLSHYPGQLSGGEQQRVALARAFAVQPKILLADEPTGNLDGGTGHAVIDLLFDLSAQHGTTLMLITHDESLAERCQRRVALVDGQIVDDGRGATKTGGWLPEAKTAAAVRG